jgi:phytanoyl-CoA hydroxylase
MSGAFSEITEYDLEFDEAWYLQAYPDIAKAVQDGAIPSALTHYIRFGREEGRLPIAFDPNWYSRVYPVAAQEVGSTDAHALHQHYLSVGLFRGYRPHPSADRLKNAAKISSSFGGLWIDHANAHDVIAGKYAVGQIDRQDASLLKSYVKDGYVRLSGAIPPVLVDRAEEALDNAYSGRIDNLLFECHAISQVHCPWVAGVRENPAKALDIHWWSEDIRNIIFCDSIARFLHLIFERPALVSQSLGFYRGSGQPLHQDSAYVPYSLPLQFTASWIALEDIAAGSGELEYLVGSHKVLPEYTYPGGFKSASESARFGTEKTAITEAVVAHEKQIATNGQRRALKRETFIAKRGDVLFWHADLAHGGSPISLKRSRKSVVTHYCPREVAPLYFENVPATIRKHGACDCYTSGVYREQGFEQSIRLEAIR